ncbi:MAG: energy transducer TonB [Gammaproteobacteria bacterium]|nr:energy transducer TonB [Gammaproteobacteria bacterium]
MARWLVSLLVALLVVLASFVMILWMISPPKARVDNRPVQVGHFVPMSRDNSESQSRSRLKAPEPPPDQVQPPSPQTPQPPQQMQATPTVKLDVSLPNLPSSLNIQAAAMPSLAGVTAARAAPAPAPAPAAASAGAPGPTGVDSEVVPLNEVLPEYPDQARRRGIEGHVKLAFTITPQGRVENIRVIESSPPNVFDRSARRAAARWRFAPRTEAGLAVEREAVKTLEFRLTQGR